MIRNPGEVAADIKQKSVIDMALTFTAMIRLFEKGSKVKICKKLHTHFQRLEGIKAVADFGKFHETFCEWFVKDIRLAQRERNGKIIKQAGFASYGQAAKLLDVALKVYVYYSGLPNKKISDALVPFLNSAIDNPILRHLKATFPGESILAKNVEQIDKDTYNKLQYIIKCDIKNRFNNDIVPTQYDDIMWYRLNRA